MINTRRGIKIPSKQSEKAGPTQIWRCYGPSWLGTLLFGNVLIFALRCSSPGFLFSLSDSVRTPRLIFIEIEMNSIFDCAFWFKTHPYSNWFFIFALIMSAWFSLFGQSVRLIVAACVLLFGMINNIKFFIGVGCFNFTSTKTLRQIW